MFTDSRQLFDVITRGKSPTERNLAVDLIAAREAYLRFEIDRVGLDRSEFNPTDEISKVKSYRCLTHLIDIG